MSINSLIGIVLAYGCIGCHSYSTFYSPQLSGSLPAAKQACRIVVDPSSPFDSVVPILSNTTRLKSLKLSGNTSANLPKILESIPKPEKLRVLILDSMNLLRLPKNISRFSKLEQLSLNHNPNLDLDQAFEILQSLPLAFLNLQSNQLQQLPKSIQKIQTLKDLNLAENHIISKKTYLYLGGLRRLTSLWLTGNKLQEIPETIGALTQVRNLYIEHNQLRKLPDQICQMKRVWVLHAGHNDFEILPEQFAQMPNLLLLHITNCSIKEIPKIYETKRANILGLIADNNPLNEETKTQWKKKFRRFFVLSL